MSSHFLVGLVIRLRKSFAKILGRKVILIKANIPNLVGFGMPYCVVLLPYFVGPLSPVALGVTIALNLRVVTFGQVFAVTVIVLF